MNKQLNLKQDLYFALFIMNENEQNVVRPQTIIFFVNFKKFRSQGFYCGYKVEFRVPSSCVGVKVQ